MLSDQILKIANKISTKIKWIEDKIGGFKADVKSKNNVIYTLHATDKGWMVARGKILIYSGKASNVEDAKKKAEKFIQQAEQRGM